MRALVLADVHANRPALDAVLEAADDRWDVLLLLGDVVGYGPHPNEVCERLRALPSLHAVRGNHDRAAVAGRPGPAFNEVARTAMAWTIDALDAGHRAWLGGLARGPLELDGARRVLLSHGTPFHEDDYLFGSAAARAVAATWPGWIVLHGHTHLPQCLGVAAEGNGVAAGGPPERRSLPPGPTWLLNPGSVGQPRDGDPAAAFGVLDLAEGTFGLHRARYDVGAVQEALRAAGLPRQLADRLGLGA